VSQNPTSVVISIPSALRGFVGGAATVEVQAETVSGALEALTSQHPKLAPHLRDGGGKIRSFVNIYLNDEDVRFLPGKDAAPVKSGDMLTIVPSIAGGVA